MPLQSPNLDDRDFRTLLAEATQRVRQSCPAWTDLSPSDPGIVMLELFAYLTDLMIYRLNRIPAKAYIEFLRLMGIKLYAPSAAMVDLRFSLERARTTAVEIPELTRVAAGRAKADSPAPVFVTAASATIAAGATEAIVRAYHVDFIQAELAGMGTGAPAQTVTVKNPPIVAPIGDFEELIVGVETPGIDPGKRVNTREYDGKIFRVWREVDSFSAAGEERYFYTVDRVTGVIAFAPAVRSQLVEGGLADDVRPLAEFPPAGMQIRVWYARGGGPEGNVMAGVLTVMKDAIAGVAVTNPAAGSGGAAAETVENALVRGPQEMHSLERAVTARDFEMFAERNAGAARAKAVTQREVWAHAVPGTVEVLLVPNYLEPKDRGSGAVTADRLREQETPEVLARVQRKLDGIKPAGTQSRIAWVKYKTARVNTDIVVYRGESPDAVKARVLKNLHDAINPLPTATNRSGWKFGEPLRVSRVYDIILAEPGVSYVDRVRLLVDDVPDKDVRALVADQHQRDTFHAAAAKALYRSMNKGESWERMGTFDDVPALLETHPDDAGLVVLVTSRDDHSGSRVFVSTDCGETWGAPVADLAFEVQDIAWTSRGNQPLLLLATDKGLYELIVGDPDAAPVQILVEEKSQDLGFYSVAVFEDARGTQTVAVSAQRNKGVYLSIEAGKSGSFKSIGLGNEDVRVLGVELEGPRSFLWAGLAVPGNEPGKGCFRWEALGSFDSPEGWRQFDKKWIGGSCYALRFDAGKVFAATHHSGVVVLDPGAADAAWSAPHMPCGLPTRDVSAGESAQIFLPVRALAVPPAGKVLLAGGPLGIYRSEDGGASYERVSGNEFTERVAIPPTWLFCSGAHEINVLREHETSGD